MKTIGFAWGPEAAIQEQRIASMAEMMGAEHLDTYTQEDIGRRSKWEQLKDAVEVARHEGALLIVATVQGKRLGLKRNIPVLTLLAEMEEGFVLVDVVASALSETLKTEMDAELKVMVLAAVLKTNMEHCQKEIKKYLRDAKKWSKEESKRRKEEMAVRLEGGWKPTPGKPDQEAGKLGNEQAAEAHAEQLKDDLLRLHEQGLSQREIAEKLNAMGHRTRRGKEFTNVQVMRLLKRFL